MMRRYRPTRAEQLQAQWDSWPDLMDARIVYRPFKGWYAEPDEGRYFGDEGEWLGDNWREALETIYWLGAPYPKRGAPTAAR
jgi:hypothetical protein